MLAAAPVAAAASVLSSERYTLAPTRPTGSRFPAVLRSTFTGSGVD